MRIAPLIAGAAMALSMAALSVPASAAPALPNLAPASSLAQTVADWDGPRHHSRADYDRGDRVEFVSDHYRRHRGHHFYEGRRHWGGGWGYCRAWRHECANRWPWMGWRYERCLRRHGC